MKFETDVFTNFGLDWALLTAGEREKFNTMTIGWGGLGTLWGKPVATVYVRPSRYTHVFMENSELFTVSFYPETCKKALGLLGTLSGRDCDKVAAAGLTPKFLEGGAVTFEEAVHTLVCKKIYKQEMDLAAIPQDAREKYYADATPHTVYIGKVIEVL